MKKVLLFILSLFLMLTLVSCVTTVSAQDELYESREIVEATTYNNAEIELVITYGTPYVIDGLVQYYIYNGLYYYPFYYRDYFYWRIYRTPLVTYPRYWRPMPRAYWFRDGRFYRPNRFDRHYHNNVIGRHRPHNDIYRHKPNRNIDRQRPNNGVNRKPVVGGQRPSSTRTTTTRPTTPRVQNRNGNFNGSIFSVPQSRPSGTMSAPSRMSTPSRGGGGHFGGRR